MHNAHPPRIRWHVETHDPLADEWSSGIPYTDPQTAVKARTYRDEHYPKWADGTPVQRRLVLETTTFEDLDADVTHCLPFPKGGFIITGVGGQDFAALPDTTPDGRPAIRFCVGSHESGHADVVLPLDLLAEVVAGQREVARQAAGPTMSSCMCGYPDDQDTVHPTNGDPCYTTVPTVGEQRAVAALDAAEGAGA